MKGTLFFLALAGMAVAGCKRDCETGSKPVYLHLLSKTDSTNQLFGPHKKYRYSDVVAYTYGMSRQDCPATVEVRNNQDSVWVIQLEELHQKHLYLQLSPTETDTLDLDMTYPQSQNCPRSFLQDIHSDKDSVEKVTSDEWRIYR